MHNMLKASLLFSLLIFLPYLIIGQEDRPPINKKSILANIDSLRIAQINLGRTKFTPFIAPSYSPELEFLVSAGGLLTFKVQKENPFLERSSIPFSVGYSSNKSLQFSARFFLYGKNDMTRAVGEWWLKKMPDNYWGVGYENGRNTNKSDSTTQYQRKWWQFKQKVMFRVKTNLFIGPILDVSKTTATELNPIMVNDPAVNEFGTLIRNTGLGFVFAFDSRDMSVNAYKGLYIDLSTTLYGTYLGGNQDFNVIELDYRQYKSLGHRRTLTWNLKTRAGFGEVPWPEMSQLGNPFDFRGYTWGRYRDKAMVLGIVEYRHMLKRKKPNKKGSFDSRFGFTGWAGLGSVSKGINDYEDWLPTIGVGLRFETQPRMNVRVDYGVGTDSNSIYVTFNEAF